MRSADRRLRRFALLTFFFFPRRQARAIKAPANPAGLTCPMISDYPRCQMRALAAPERRRARLANLRGRAVAGVSRTSVGGCAQRTVEAKGGRWPGRVVMLERREVTLRYFNDVFVVILPLMRPRGRIDTPVRNLFETRHSPALVLMRFGTAWGIFETGGRSLRPQRRAGSAARLGAGWGPPPGIAAGTLASFLTRSWTSSK